MTERVAFVNPTTQSIHSVYVPSSMPPDIPMMPPQQEPETPEGCVRMVIPETIRYINAMKVVLQEDGTLALEADEDALQVLRDKALPHIRKTRNELLGMCDYKMMTDYVLSEEARQQWSTYRQALREITLQDPLSVTWPTMPN